VKTCIWGCDDCQYEELGTCEYFEDVEQDNEQETEDYIEHGRQEFYNEWIKYTEEWDND
jgi:hypothetical protein